MYTIHNIILGAHVQEDYGTLSCGCLCVCLSSTNIARFYTQIKCRTLGALCIYGACTNTIICTCVTVNSVSIIVHAPIIINRCMLFCLVLAQKTCSPDLHTLCLIGTIGCQGPSLGA